VMWEQSKALFFTVSLPGGSKWQQHPGFDVSNFHRIVVHGSTPVPPEYLRLTDDPRTTDPTTESSFGPFSWERVIPNP
jgi:hypothetical protein